MAGKSTAAPASATNTDRSLGNRLTGGDPVGSTFPPTEPTRQHVDEALLALVRDLRHLAYDPTLSDDDRARRVRDRFGEFDRK
jgi:hypothetical protein